MKGYLILSAIIAVLTTVRASAGGERQDREQAHELLVKVYIMPSTEKFCTANPEATYWVTIDKLTFPVDCKTRNEYVAGLMGRKKNELTE